MFREEQSAIVSTPETRHYKAESKVKRLLNLEALLSISFYLLTAPYFACFNFLLPFFVSMINKLSYSASRLRVTLSPVSDSIIRGIVPEWPTTRIFLFDNCLITPAMLSSHRGGK